MDAAKKGDFQSAAATRVAQQMKENEAKKRQLVMQGVREKAQQHLAAKHARNVISLVEEPQAEPDEGAGQNMLAKHAEAIQDAKKADQQVAERVAAGEVPHNAPGTASGL